MMKTLVVMLVLLSGLVLAQDFYVDHDAVIFDGEVRTERDGDTLRISFTSALLDNLPEAPSEEDFDVPSPSNTFYETINMAWNPQGHAPVGVWTYPHFDIHFYTVDRATRSRAVCSSFPPCPNDAISSSIFAPVNPLYLPEGYAVDVNSGVPNMGIHSEWLADPQFADDAAEWEGATFIYGFIDGELAFLEPMVSLALFRSKATWIQKVHQPQVYSESGDWPMEHRVYWDKRQDRHVIELSGLVSRQKGEVSGDYSDSSSASGLTISLFSVLLLIFFC